ncbi:MAG: Flp pilus assembly protein CpaB [Rhodospirillales bacterium]|nr:Flp pilus assembly protein CpaB [Rhodospirillales bacterium]
MVVRIALFALMALGLAGFGTVAWIATRGPAVPHKVVAAPPEKIAVLVAAHPLQPGILLQPSDLSAISMLSPAVPPGASRDTPADRAGLIGAMIRRPMLQGQPFLPLDVMRPGDHGFLAAVLAPGMRAVTVGVDEISGGAGLIWPGDRVDLVLTQQIADKNLPLGKRLAAETVLSDVRVIAIDQHLVQGENPNGLSAKLARTATLEVTPLEAEQVAVATRLGQLSLVVRSADPTPGGLKRDHPAIAWAGQVSPALNVAVPAHGPGATLRVFRGAAKVEKVHF